MSDREPFDDVLGLAGRSFAGVDAVTFHGESGTGKSTAIAWLLARHPAYAGARRGELAVFDDMESAREVRGLLAALRRGRRVLAACHFHPAWLWPLRVRFRVESFTLDDRPEKIERWLARRGVTASAAAVAAFCRRYGANYTDAAIVLERAPGASFDEALGRFLRECRIDRAAPRPRREADGGGPPAVASGAPV